MLRKLIITELDPVLLTIHHLPLLLINLLLTLLLHITCRATINHSLLLLVVEADGLVQEIRHLLSLSLSLNGHRVNFLDHREVTDHLLHHLPHMRHI